MDLSVDFKGKIVLVTGAAQGVGLAVARAFVNNNARVFGVDIDDGISKSADAWGGIGYRADVSDPDEVSSMVDACVDRLGSPDVLVNIAAISTPCEVEFMTLENWRKNVDVNLTSVFLCTKAVLPLMMKKGAGCIISFSSVVAETGGKSSAHYAAAKGGVEAFSRSLAREVGPSGIRVNVVAPGMVDTRMLALMSDAQKSALAGRNPIMRIGLPEDMVGPVLFLASEAASYVTGHTLSVNGGMAMS